MGKKVVALLVSMMMIFSIFVGCSNKEANTEEAGEKVTKEEVKNDVKDDESKVDEDKIEGELVVWGWEMIKTAQDSVIEGFNEKYPDVEVKFVNYKTADLFKKLLLGISSGGKGVPDVFCIQSSEVAKLVNTGGLVDISDIASPHMDDINAFKWADVVKDDQVYAMPWDSGPVALYYRTDVFEEAGLPTEPEEVASVLNSWDDYYVVAKVIKEKTGKPMFALSTEQPTGRTFEKFMWQQGQVYFNDAGEVDLVTDNAVRTLEFMKKMVKEDLTENTVEWTQPWYDGMANGNVATVIGAVWQAGNLSGWIAPDASGLWRVVPLPVWDEGGCRTANDGGSNFAIPKGAKNEKAAKAYIEYMLADSTNQLKMYEATDIFPSLETTYTDEFFDQPIDYFGGQKVRRLFADTVSQVPPIKYTENYYVANEVMIDVLMDYIHNDLTATEALNKAEEALKLRIK